MNFKIPSNNLPFTLVIGIKTQGKQRIIIAAKDSSKPNTYYFSRGCDIDGYKEFDLKFPQSAKLMDLTIFNAAKGNFKNDEDKTFSITKYDVEKLKTCPLWMNSDVSSFVKFAQWFSDNAGWLSAGKDKAGIYRSENSKFCIDYYDKIKDRRTGKTLSTPARVGHTTGIIEISKDDFVKYTVPMRMIILLHEFSHKWMNKLSNREINDEVAADINALNIYLSLGYPSIEAEYAFLKVFKDANNEFNHKRYKILDDFIKKFTSGQLKNKCVTDYSVNK